MAYPLRFLDGIGGCLGASYNQPTMLMDKEGGMIVSDYRTQSEKENPDDTNIVYYEVVQPQHEQFSGRQERMRGNSNKLTKGVIIFALGMVAGQVVKKIFTDNKKND